MEPHQALFEEQRDVDRNEPSGEAETAPADELARVARRLRAAGEALRRRPVDQILGTLNEVLAAWLVPDSPWRRAAEEALPDATGFSPQMIRHALPSMFEPLRPPALRELLDRELGDRSVLDADLDGRCAAGPGLVAHILSGNLAGMGVIPVALGLAIKSPSLLKTASGDRVTAVLFARSIAAVDPQLGACVAVRYWKGGNRRCEDRVFACADLVVMSGSDESVADARARCQARFIGHGHKISFAVVAREVAGNDTAALAAAEALAMDASVWDQRGCLSPHVCLVEGTVDSARRFGGLVADGLGRLALRLPPGATTLNERAALRRFRDDAEWRRLAGDGTSVFASPRSLDWTVVVEPLAVFRPTPLCRSLRVMPLARVDDLPRILAPAARLLECAGLAAPQGREQEIGNVLTRVGVPRVCPLGRMQLPTLSWQQGGRPRIADWVEWTK